MRAAIWRLFVYWGMNTRMSPRQATGSEEDINFLLDFNGKAAEVKCLRDKEKDYFLIIIGVSDSNKVILYEYDILIECIISSRIKDISEKDKNIKQFKIFNQLNFLLLRLMGQVRLDTNGYEPLKEYHIEERLRLVDTSINNLKLELEVEKLDKENRYFIIPVVFSGAALIIALLSPFLEKISNKLFEMPKKELKQAAPPLKSDAPKLSTLRMDSLSGK
jgi:hypothetical protein